MRNLLAEFYVDVCYALRTLSKAPALTAISIVTLAVGIGATTAIFSVVNGVLLRPLPYASPERLVRIVETVPPGELPGVNFTMTRGIAVSELAEWRKAESLSHVAVSGVVTGRVLATAEGGVQLRGAPVSPALFAMRGIRPLLGRGLAPEEERADAAVVVLGEAAWRQHFGADPNLLGRAISLDGQPFMVVGVMPTEFGPEDFWTPLFVPPASGPGLSFAPTFARLSDGVSFDTAAAEINALGLALRNITPQPGAAPRFAVVSELDQITGRVMPALRTLVVAVVAVLLIVCTNVANLLLVRGTQRRQEIAIRRSLGATRGRIARLVLAESSVLAAIAAAFGVALAFGAVELLKATAVVDLPRRFQVGFAILPRVEEIAIDTGVLAFAVGLAVITGTLFGLLPALRLSRFGEKGHNAAAQLSAAASNTRAGHALATVQLAFATALLIAAGLVLNSFLRVAVIDTGYDPRGVLNFELVVPRNATAERKLEVAQALAARLRQDPRVTAVGFVDLPPLIGTGLWVMASFVPEGMTPAEAQQAENALPLLERTGTRTASVGYLRAVGVRLVDGTWPADPPNRASFDVIVTRQYAQRYFPGRSAIGATLQSAGRTATIVGVTDDILLGSIAGPTQSVVFMEPAQSLEVQRARIPNPQTFDQLFLTSGFVSGINFAARSDGNPLAIAPSLRSIVRDIDPTFAVDSVIPMQAMVYGVTAQPRFYASLLSTFGAVAAFVALIGVYGVLAYVVSQRTKEIGIRMALGAQRRSVLELVLRRGATMVAIGVTAGVLGALAVTRYLEGMLYGITALDGATYAVVAAAFAAVALFASYMPARRATSVDPLVALRHE